MPIAQQFRSETFGGMGEMCLASDPNSRIANIEETFALAINTNFLGFGYDCNTWASNTKIEADSYKEVVCAEPQYMVNTCEIDEFRASDFFCVKR